MNRVEEMPNPGAQPCHYCSGNGVTTYHTGQCPKIKAILYHPNGAIKRVEFHEVER